MDRKRETELRDGERDREVAGDKEEKPTWRHTDRKKILILCGFKQPQVAKIFTRLE